MKVQNQNWLCLMIGNSRLHWAWFTGETLQKSWDSPHHNVEQTPQKLINAIISPHLSSVPTSPLYIASVVPEQLSFWKTYTETRVISLEQIPLSGLYETLGIDRALALWGAGERYGFPALVVDGGTALTLTGANSQGKLMGGAILPGLRLQMQSLAQNTAALPEAPLPHQFPSRWALATSEAIASGIIYTIIASLHDFIQDWWLQFPESSVVFTGGDGQLLWSYLQVRYPAIADKIKVDPHLIFWGIRGVKRIEDKLRRI